MCVADENKSHCQGRAVANEGGSAMIVKRNGKYLSRPADGRGGRLKGQTFDTKREAEDHEDKCKREVRGGTWEGS